MNKETLKTGGLALLMALAPGAAKAVPLINTPDLSLNLGGVFEELGELENVTNRQAPTYNSSTGALTAATNPREDTRIYLFQTQDMLRIDGNLDGTKFWFRSLLGGTELSTSNNVMDLLEYYAEVPLNGNSSVVIGQFQVPSNLSSAQDVGKLLFTESSPIFQNFFNQGYDNGVGYKAAGKGWDATAGTISGAPDLPLRFLPEIFQLPPLLYTRFGIGNIPDDPYHQQQAVQVKDSQWGLHFNGEYVADSNAGHSDDIALQSGDTGDGNNVFGNVLTWSSWNPFMGKTSSGVSTSTEQANYFNTSVDAQYRAPLGDDTLILSAQASFAEYNNEGEIREAADEYQSRATVNLSGGEFVAGVTGDQGSLAARLDIVLPSDYLMNNSSVQKVNGKAIPAYQPNQITGDAPIVEISFPSITLKVNKYARITAESIFWLNSTVASGDDGTYVLAEMPSQVTNLFPGNSAYHDAFIPAGRMAFTLDF